MPVALSYPGVYIEEVRSGVRTITGVATSIALFIGWAARGPTDRAVRLTSFSDYERQFGGLDTRTLLPYAVKQFYDNGGADAYVIRLTKDATSASAKSGSLTVTAGSPGAWANEYSFRITHRADDPTATARFKLEVLKDLEGPPKQSVVVESFENLSMSNMDGRFVETIINERSSFIGVKVTGVTDPANGAKKLNDTTAGDDGTVLDPDSTTPATAAAFHAAVLGCFGVGSITDRIDLFNIVCVPGETDEVTLGQLQTECQRKRAFLLVDCEKDATVASMQKPLAAALVGSSARNAALYFPWVSAPDPSREGAIRTFPPCGYVAGVFARTDSSRGVWKAPAGSDASLNGAAGLAVSMSDAENGKLNPHGVNCLRTLPVYGNVVWGSRTLDGDDGRASEWKYVPVRRMALFLEESLYRGTQWVVFEPNDEPLWAQIRLNLGAFMQNLFRQGAFQGKSPREAYFVKCDRETTTQSDINLGIVNIVVGFAPLKPAEFVIIKLQQIAGDIAT
jgi:Bacteriophage tail sheath protein